MRDGAVRRRMTPMTVHHVRAHTRPADPEPRGVRGLRWTTVAVTLFAGMNAVGGGAGLAINGLGLPKGQLVGTPFDSFLVPGLLLAVVVGGGMLAAAVATWRRSRRAAEATIGAGAIMLGWIAVEAVMIDDGRQLQIAVALVALLTLTLGWLRLRLDRAAR
jgi:hypothetical protein